MSDTRNIADWQRRFRAAPAVWVTFFYERETGTEEISNVYESAEAAAIEVEWHKARHPHRRPPIVRQIHVHSFALADERWTS